VLITFFLYIGILKAIGSMPNTTFSESFTYFSSSLMYLPISAKQKALQALHKRALGKTAAAKRDRPANHQNRIYIFKTLVVWLFLYDFSTTGCSALK